MIADLFEAYQEREDDAFARYALLSIERLCEFLDRLLVQRGLRGAQVTERLHLGLVGQIGDHRLVGLEAPQYIRAHQLPQRTVSFRSSETPDVAPKSLTGAEQSGVREVENRPKIAETILHRCAGERDPGVGDELLDGARLLRARVLDGLRLVNDGDTPLGAQEPVVAQQRTIARDHKINRAERLRRH